VVGVKPRKLRGVEQRRIDQPPVEGREGQRLEPQERLGGAGLDQEQILQADAV